MKKLLLLAMILFSLFTLTACQQRNFTDIDNAELENMLENKEDYYFIDVRTSTEYYDERIPGFTINLDYYTFEDKPSKLDSYITSLNLDKTKPVVIMCNSGNRSVDASNMFTAAGFSEVYNLENGIQGWNGETE